MQVGRQKGNYRLRLIDLESGKSKTTTIYARDKKNSLESIMKKIINSLIEENKE
ncbi:MAG: hypothetical protein ABH986_06965 [archaeon]